MSEIPPGEGVMGVTARKSYKREIRELREALAAVEKERDDIEQNRDHWRKAYVELDINYRRALNETTSEGERK
jgi:hypothetical protein